MLSFDWIYLFWMYAFILDGYLMYFLGKSVYLNYKREKALEMQEMWRIHFETEVASQWIHYDGQGG